MKKIPIIRIIIIVLIISIVIAIIVSQVGSGGNDIIPIPIDDKEKCDVSSDITLLKSCDPTNQDSCNNCSGGPHSCFTVTDDKPYHFSVDDTILNVPNGNWCLPAQTRTVPCNQFTGYPVLTKNDNEYIWRCQCKYPTLFKNAGVWGDCTQEVACNALEGQGNLVKPNSSTKWVDDPTWDPTVGVCKCNNDLKYIDQSNPELGIWSKQCVKDSCSPGKTVGNDCLCGDGYLKCPTDLPDSTKSICDPNNPQCIVDPCKPGGYYDINKQICVCNTDAGYTSIPNSQSPVKSICASPCSPGGINPCEGKGECYIDSTSGKEVVKCKNCIYPWYQDSNNMCNNPMKKNGSKCEHSYECLSGTCERDMFGTKVC